MKSCSFLLSFFNLSLTVNYDMSTAKDLLLLTSSQEEQQRWVSHLLKRIPRKPPTVSHPSAAQSQLPEATSRSSPRPSPRGSPHLSHRGAIKMQSTRPQQPSGKPRWRQGKSLCISPILNLGDIKLLFVSSIYILDCNHYLYWIWSFYSQSRAQKFPRLHQVHWQKWKKQY